MSDAGDLESREETKNLFHRGLITKLFPSNNMGLVRTESGREIPFTYQMVVLVGEAKKPQDLREGQEVGYDLGWTSKGLRVTKIKTYPPAPAGENAIDLKRQGGQSQDLPSQNLADKDSE